MSRRTILFIRWGVFLLACGFLYLRLAQGDGALDLSSALSRAKAGAWLDDLGLVLFLMLLNWGGESFKWRILVRGVEHISPVAAFKATLAGTSIGLITPNRVGEFVGRVLFLAPENRIPASFATAVGSIAQFVTTLVFGTLAFVVPLLMPGDPVQGYWQTAAWAGLCTVVVLASLVLYFAPGLLRAFSARLPIIRKWKEEAAVLEGFRTPTLLVVLLLSALRYVVFTLQFAILLLAFADIPIADSIPVIPIVFLFSTLIPTVVLTELGIRGSVAIALLSPGTAQDEGVFLASTCLWLVNIALPAIVGSVVLLLARIRSTSNP